MTEEAGGKEEHVQLPGDNAPVSEKNQLTEEAEGKEEVVELPVHVESQMPDPVSQNKLPIEPDGPPEGNITSEEQHIVQSATHGLPGDGTEKQHKISMASQDHHGLQIVQYELPMKKNLFNVLEFSYRNDDNNERILSTTTCSTSSSAAKNIQQGGNESDETLVDEVIWSMLSEEEIEQFLDLQESGECTSIRQYIRNLKSSGRKDLTYFLGEGSSPNASPADPSPDSALAFEISSANILSTKRVFKPSYKIYEKIDVTSFTPRVFNQMDKAKALFQYLMSKEGQSQFKRLRIFYFTNYFS